MPKEPYKRDYILQKRPIILRNLLIVATQYCAVGMCWSVCCWSVLLECVFHICTCSWLHTCLYIHILECIAYMYMFMSAHMSIYTHFTLYTHFTRTHSHLHTRIFTRTHKNNSCIHLSTQKKLMCTSIYTIVPAGIPLDDVLLGCAAVCCWGVLYIYTLYTLYIHFTHFYWYTRIYIHKIDPDTYLYTLKCYPHIYVYTRIVPAGIVSDNILLGVCFSVWLGCVANIYILTRIMYCWSVFECVVGACWMYLHTHCIYLHTH